jgi:pseudaminic acid synthase
MIKMDNELQLTKNRTIGESKPAYIIAEMSANHAGSKKRALEIIRAAKDAGADCVKVQTYTPDTMTIDSSKKCFQIDKGTWEGENLYNLYKKAYTPWEWQEELKNEAERIGIDFFSTPYENTAVDFLENLGVEFYKVASFSIINIPFLKYLAQKNKPIIMSTGMATLGEIEEAVRTIREEGNNNLALLNCSSAYPSIPDDMNLKNIKNLEEIFDLPVGLSDHSLGSVAAVTSIAMGAKIIEKHFCLSREIENPDASFSMEPAEFKQMVDDIRVAEKAIGKVDYSISEKEKESRIFRRSIFVVDDIKAGEKLTEKNVRIIRPGHGLKPKNWYKVLGKGAVKDIEKGTPLDWSLIK